MSLSHSTVSMSLKSISHDGMMPDAASLLQSSSGNACPTLSQNESNLNSLSNSHFRLKNYSMNSVSTSMEMTAENQTSSFFIMVTGSIESVTTGSVNGQLYCRYAFSYGSDWSVVHGVSLGFSQVGRQGVSRWKGVGEDGSSVTILNFPIEISFESTNPHGWPRLALSIYGFDFLGRDVLCGHASLLLPINPGRHIKYLRTFRPVSGGKCEQLINWFMGTNPEYYDSKMINRSEGRGVTRVVSEDGMVVKVNLFVTRKDFFNSFGYVSQSVKSCE